MSEPIETLRHQLAVLVEALQTEGAPVPPEQLQVLIALAESLIVRLKRELLARPLDSACPERSRRARGEAIPADDYGPPARRGGPAAAGPEPSG